MNAKELLSKYQIPELPVGARPDFIDALLVHLEMAGGFNDVYLHSGGRVISKVHGQVIPIIKRKIIDSEITGFIQHITKDGSAKAYMQQGNDIDCSYFIVTSDNKRYRYRVNITCCHTARGNKGFQITMRSINPVPPTVNMLGVEPELLESMVVRQGLVLIVGETGSGKSTLLAAVLRYMMEMENGNRVILTYEAPIEYVHDTYPANDSNEIYQHEINPVGGHLRTFRDGVRNALRRNPNVILIGESRDRETMEEMQRAANTGHLCLTTAHANSVSDAISRVINEFPEDARKARLYELISNLRVVVVQYLASGVDGKRTPVKEYLIFTDEVRAELLNEEPHRIAIKIKEVMNRYLGCNAKTMAYDAERIYREGKISEQEYQKIISGI